jgi:hypothetical protein
MKHAVEMDSVAVMYDVHTKFNKDRFLFLSSTALRGLWLPSQLAAMHFVPVLSLPIYPSSFTSRNHLLLGLPLPRTPNSSPFNKHFGALSLSMTQPTKRVSLSWT